jgi:hypothetical protein
MVIHQKTPEIVVSFNSSSTRLTLPCQSPILGDGTQDPQVLVTTDRLFYSEWSWKLKISNIKTVAPPFALTCQSLLQMFASGLPEWCFCLWLMHCFVSIGFHHNVSVWGFLSMWHTKCNVHLFMENVRFINCVWDIKVASSILVGWRWRWLNEDKLQHVVWFSALQCSSKVLH